MWPKSESAHLPFTVWQLCACNLSRVRHISAMARTARKQEAGYSYAEVEGALGTLFGVTASAKGSFRGRVRHFQRIGLVEVAPGRGRRIWYTRVQAGEWMLALYL